MDRSVVLAYVTVTADLQAARAAWAAEGSPLTIARPAGQRPHPMLQLVRQLSRDVATYAAELGLSPRGRRALGVEVAPTAEPDDRSPYFT